MHGFKTSISDQNWSKLAIIQIHFTQHLEMNVLQYSSQVRDLSDESDA